MYDCTSARSFRCLSMVQSSHWLPESPEERHSAATHSPQLLLDKGKRLVGDTGFQPVTSSVSAQGGVRSAPTSSTGSVRQRSSTVNSHHRRWLPSRLPPQVGEANASSCPPSGLAAALAVRANCWRRSRSSSLVSRSGQVQCHLERLVDQRHGLRTHCSDGLDHLIVVDRLDVVAHDAPREGLVLG